MRLIPPAVASAVARALALVVLTVAGGCSSSTAPSDSSSTGPTGPVLVTVTWDTAADVDLHVVEPSGNEIYWDNASSSTGGKLDTDANQFCAQNAGNTENIRWTNNAPGGTYVVRVDYYKSCGVASTNFTVSVTNGTTVTSYTGSLSGLGDFGALGSGTLVTTFRHGSGP